MQKPSQNEMAVVAAPAVRELLGREPDARHFIEAFARGDHGNHRLPLAGPPSIQELAKYLPDTAKGIELPVVVISLSVKRNNTNGRREMHIAVSDADLLEITRWNAQHKMGRIAPRRLIGTTGML